MTRLSRFLTVPANLIVVVILAFAAADAIESLWLPFGWDSGMMASVGEVIARGEMPYRDGWDLKAPLAYLPYALSVLLTGHSMWGVRLFELMVMAPCVYMMFRTVSAWTTWRIGAVAGAGLFIWIQAAGFAHTAQPEVWATAAITIAISLILRPGASATLTPAAFFIMGALIGCASMVKPHLVAFGLAPAVFLAMTGMLFRKPLHVAAFAVGGVIPVALTLGWIVLGGALPAFLDIVEFLTGPYSGAHSLSGMPLVNGVFRFLTSGAMPAVITLSVIGVWSFRRHAVFVSVLLTWLVVALLCVIVQAKLYAYHWFPLYPPLTVCAALGAYVLLAQKDFLVRAGTVSLFAAIVLAAGLSPLRDVGRWGRLLIDHDLAKFHAGYYMVPYNSNDIIQAAHYVRDRTDPTETLFVWGNDATIRYLSERKNPSRFTFVLPLRLKSAARERYRAELMETLRATPPAYIAVGGPWGDTGPFGPKDEAWADFPEFAALVTGDYRLETSIGNIDLYVRRNR